MCFEYLKKKFPKSSRQLTILQKIVRILALIEGISGIIIIVVQLTIRALRYDKTINQGGHSHNGSVQSTQENFSTEQHSEKELTKLVVLAFFGLQALLALLLFEGARRKIICMIKTWLIFCFFKLLIPLTIILYALFRQKKKFNPMWWTLTIEIASASFNIIEYIFVLLFHHQAKMAEDDDIV